MNKKVSLILVAVALLSLSTLQVKALDVSIDANGFMKFYDDQVLGDETNTREREEVEHKEIEKREIKLRGGENKLEKNDQLKSRVMTPEKRTTPPIKNVAPAEKNQLRLKNDGKETHVILEKEKPPVSITGDKRGEFERQETTKDDRVKVEIPAELKEKREARKEAIEQKKEEVKERIEEKREEIKQKIEAVKEERAERKNEKIELRTQENEKGEKEFVFESRLMKAKAKGAEFVVDPATNNVTITAPNGKEHVLTHLPDQAIMRMKAAGLFDTEALETGASELELETKSDGSVVYSSTFKKPKKILGLFPRKVETKVELNDDTGEVTEEEVEADSFMGKLLNSMAQ